MKINNKDTCLLKKVVYIYISIKTKTKKLNKMKTLKNSIICIAFLLSNALKYISEISLKYSKKLNRFVATYHYTEYE